MFDDEDNKIELKEVVADSVPKEIVSFLNTDGGNIYIGIKKIEKLLELKTSMIL